MALGGELRVMAASVIGELVRASDAVAGALWLRLAPRDALTCACARPEPDAVVAYPGAVAGDRRPTFAVGS